MLFNSLTFVVFFSLVLAAYDIAIGVTAAHVDAVLLAHNRRDFADIPELKVEGAARPSRG